VRTPEKPLSTGAGRIDEDQRGETMAGLALESTSGGRTDIPVERLEELVAGLRGEIVTPDCETYDEVRSIWNAFVDRRPGLIVRCHGAADVRQAVAFASDNDVLMSVRGGGHHIAGNSVCEGGMMVDLSPMRAVRVDPERRTVRIEPGASGSARRSRTRSPPRTTWTRRSGNCSRPWREPCGRLDVEGVPQSVSFPAGHVTDPREDLNPEASVAVTR
jgi:hypothetical protein